VNWAVVEPASQATTLLWQDLPDDLREALAGKLSALWGAASDEAAFDGFAVERQQALLLVLSRLRAKRLWQVIAKIDNVYGDGGVGIAFTAAPLILTTLRDRRDFTRFLAKHKGTAGGFYEKGRASAVLHFIYQGGEQQKWYLHFDLYSPVHSLLSAFKHLRYELFGRVTPDWRMIQERLHAEP